METSKLALVFGALSGLISIAMGAFGAHALKEKLTERMLAVFHTAAQYQMVHALALVSLGIWLSIQPVVCQNQPIAHWIVYFWILGTLIFSGSLYALALTDIRWLGAITPVGGLSFMAGWLILAVVAWKLN